MAEEDIIDEEENLDEDGLSPSVTKPKKKNDDGILDPGDASDEELLSNDGESNDFHTEDYSDGKAEW